MAIEISVSSLVCNMTEMILRMLINRFMVVESMAIDKFDASGCDRLFSSMYYA
jgi:hypothetical protein